MEVCRPHGRAGQLTLHAPGLSSNHNGNEAVGYFSDFSTIALDLPQNLIYKSFKPQFKHQQCPELMQQSLSESV